MLSRKSEQLLNKIYYNVKHPAGFSNASRLYHAVKVKGITFQDVREFLSRQRAHQLTRPNRYNYARRRTVSMGLDYFWQAHLVEVGHDAYSRRINQGVNYLLGIGQILRLHHLVETCFEPEELAWISGKIYNLQGGGRLALVAIRFMLVTTLSRTLVLSVFLNVNEAPHLLFG